MKNMINNKMHIAIFIQKAIAYCVNIRQTNNSNLGLDMTFEILIMILKTCSNSWALNP